jgi:hypothetical protein
MRLAAALPQAFRLLYRRTVAQIQVTRTTKSYPDPFRAYQVVIDGAVVGKVTRGETANIPVEPGHHEVWMRIDWCRSRAVAVDVTPSQTLRLECEPNARVLLLPMYLTVWRGRYVALRRAETRDMANPS